MTDLILHLKAEYWHDIREGRKPFEFRLNTPFWQKRIVGKTYDRLILCLGYPKRGDMTRRIVMPYQGYEMQRITHNHFFDGNMPVKVFAIRTPADIILNPEILLGNHAA